MKKIFTCILALTMLAGVTNTRAATHYWTGGGSDENWGNPLNWAGGQPLVGEAAPVVIIFTNSVTTTNNMSGLVVDSLQFHVAGCNLHGSGIGSLTLRGGNSSTNLWFKTGATMIDDDLPVGFTGTNLCIAGLGTTANIRASLSGSGEIIWGGSGTVTYGGSLANTFSGTTSLREAHLQFSRPAGVNAIAGPLVLENIGPAGYKVELLSSNQIADSVIVTIEAGKSLYSTSFGEKVGGIIFKGGNVNLTSGLLTLGGNVTVTTNGNYSGGSIGSPVSLGGVTRTFTIYTNANFTFSGVISDGGAAAGINVVGGGEIGFLADNTFTGPVQVTNSTLHIDSPLSLGTAAAGTFIDTNSSLKISGAGVVAGEALTLAGTLNNSSGTNNFWNGTITLAAGSDITVNNSSQITLNGVVSGAGALVKNGVGTLVLAGSSANTYSGGTEINGGLLVLSKTNATAIPGALRFVERNTTKEVRLAFPNQIANAATVTLTNQSVLNFTNNSEAIGSLAGSTDLVSQPALLSLGTGTLTNSGSSTTTFAGNITGTGPLALVKTGAGSLTLSGSNTCTGACLLNQGTLTVNGVLPGAITQSLNTYLAGTGTVGQVTCNSGYIQPAGANQGTLKTGGLVFNSSSAVAFMELGITTNDALNVTGSVTLNNCYLSLDSSTAGKIGKKFTLIANDGADAISGTFNGLSEGANIPYGSLNYTISYIGGTGNDVVLTQTTQPAGAQISSITKQLTGQMVITGHGENGVTFDMQASTNLASTNWISLGLVYSDGFGNISFTDTNAISFKQRFYRLVQQ